MPKPRATYRLQLTPEFTFAHAERVVPYLRDLGISHLYLSPIAEATRGSAHGYDGTDPTSIRAELGGESGFRALAAAAHAHGLGILLDIVPNHLAASTENPFWRDVLARGLGSPFAQWFEVRWGENGGRIVLPVLSAPREELEQKGELSRAGGELRWHAHRFPLPETHYELVYWRDGVRRVNWRRYLDVTELVCLRMHDPDVFAATHELPLRLVREGVVDGLRVDHVDGLLEPAAYLRRLRAAAGPACWIVVEHGAEAPPDWPVDGTTGYDFLRDALLLMHDAEGLARLRAAHRAFVGTPPPDRAELERFVESAMGSPPARGGACVAWDKTRNKLVVFGGDTGGSTPALLGDTWEWDPGTNAWTAVTTTTSPTPRRFAAMAHDPSTGGMLLFGGETALTSPASKPSNETWLLLAGNWLQLNPATSPPARKLHSLATRYDFGDIFLCCGDDASVTPQVRHLDAWRWTGGGWVSFTTTTFPHGTTANQAIYDPLRKRIVVQGGQGISVPNTSGGGQYGDLYGGSPSPWCSEFDCITNQWYLYGGATFSVNDTVIGRISRYFAGFIPALGKIYKVSGQNPSGVGTITATCEYEASPVAAATVVGTGCVGLALSATAPDDRPWIGRNFKTTCTGLAAGSLPLALIGSSSTPTLLSLLHPAGGAGCSLLSSLEIQLLLSNIGGAAVLGLPIPNDPAFVAVPLYHQVIQIQASGASLTALTSSNGLRFTFGIP